MSQHGGETERHKTKAGSIYNAKLLLTIRMDCCEGEDEGGDDIFCLKIIVVM